MVIDSAESQYSGGSTLREPNLYDKYQTFPRRPPFPVPSSSAGGFSIAGSRGGGIKLLQEADAYLYHLQLAAKETYCCRAGGFTHRAHITWSVIGYLCFYCLICKLQTCV
ncbi:hypothetical protein FVEG_14816 [Fusarium verticillioides 7600]|uniref:Uncharacterized protein n=1 Tax=Gibberella moniliformis (strain M3125 / FGSC 7600) TaxID=334819 RepID=W7LHH9_GIBM7|nr:hypothetical protein FVEG_14816 [Fusarium verticillioides 7600]EWG37961.1 hypothetical protein FVEG_14816 [Fusarium verticillioides 7600]